MPTIQAAQEAAEDVIYFTTSILKIGEDMPLVGGLCTAVLNAKDMVEEASRNKEELGKLCERCRGITVQVVEKLRGTPSLNIDVSTLEGCVEDLEKVAKRYGKKCCCARLAQFRKDGEDIQDLKTRIDNAINDLTAAGVVEMNLAMQEMREIWARLQPGPKLAPVPKNANVTKSWYVVRDRVVDRVCKILDGDGGPAVAALTGRSGAGKTTAATAMVGERGDRVRELFPDGVVWLRVGQGAGAADRLPSLMLELAKRLHEDVMNEGVDAPEVGEHGESYVKKIVLQEKLRCLVVADDVSHAEVVEKLRKTGMWVLLTTREPSMVEPNERVVIDTLMPAEAENVLRGTAELPPGEHLCDAAMKVLDICGRVAMDTAFVGSWSSVRTTHGKTKSKEAWARVVKAIEAQGGAVSAERDVNRLAVLRAGFKYIGREDPLAQELYAELAVFPDGHAFGESDAVMLLGDGEVAKEQVLILERWGVLRADASETYRMHDAHVDFARGKLMGWEDVRKPAVQRWTTHISRLEVAVGFDLYTLLDMWHTLKGVKSEGDLTSRPYDDQLVRMDISDRSKSHAVNFVAEIFNHDQKFVELETLMQRILKQCDDHGGDKPNVQMIALFHTRRSLFSQGRFQELEDLTHRLGGMVGPSFQAQESDCGTDFAHASTAFHFYGVCAMAGGRLKDAEEWFRKALKVEEDCGRAASSRAVSTLHEMGRCMQKAGDWGEAKKLFERALEIKETKLGADHLSVAWTLDGKGLCALQAGRLWEAEELFEMARRIKETKLGADDLDLAVTLHNLGLCVRQAWRLGEAEKLFARALRIKEARLTADDVDLALTLEEMGRCVREAWRPGLAEGWFQRALAIFEAKLGADDPQFAWTLNELGLCARHARRPVKAGELFKQALEIFEAKSGAYDVDLAVTQHSMGLCAREAGRPEEAKILLKRALDIKVTKLGADSPQVAWTLHEMGLCARETGRPDEAEEFFKRALEIFEAKLRAEDGDLVVTLHSMGLCAREAGQPEKAEGLFRRARETEEAKMVTDNVISAVVKQRMGRYARPKPSAPMACAGGSQVDSMLHEENLCLRQAGRPGEAEKLFTPAQEIMGTTYGAVDVDLAVPLHNTGVSVREAEELSKRTPNIKEIKLGADVPQASWMLYKMGHSARQAGRSGEAEELFNRALEISAAKLEADDLDLAVTLHNMGLYARQAGRPAEAEKLFGRALEIQEDRFGGDHLDVARTLHEIGVCERYEDMRQALRLGEAQMLHDLANDIMKMKVGAAGHVGAAVMVCEMGCCMQMDRNSLNDFRLWKTEEKFHQALRIQEAKLGLDDLHVAVTLHELGLCVRQAGRPGDAEKLLRRALEIFDARADHVNVAWTRFELGLCAWQAGRPGETEKLLWRALKIQEAKLGADHLNVAGKLDEMGLYTWQAGRLKEAEALFWRSLKIKEAKLGADHISVAVTLVDIGRYARQRGRLGKAEMLFKRALEITKTILGADHPHTARTMHEMGLGALQAGRAVEAKELFDKALGIFDAKLGADHLDAVRTRFELGLCTWQPWRPGETKKLVRRALDIFEASGGVNRRLYVAREMETLGDEMKYRGVGAETLFRGALKIKEATLGVDDQQVAVTLRKLGRCVLEAGRPGEAEALLRRALRICEGDNCGWADDTILADVLSDLGRCLQEVERPGDAEGLFRRALRIREGDNRGWTSGTMVADALSDLGRCVREAGQPGDAVPLFERALEMFEAKLGPDDVVVATTRFELYRCLEEAGGPAATE